MRNRSIDRLLNTWFGDVLNQMNRRLLKQGTCVIYALSGHGRGVGSCFNDEDCEHCISSYLYTNERKSDSMYLWHYKLIPVLPTDILLRQWKECITIAYDISKDQKLDDINISKIMNYPIQQFRDYCNMVLVELNKRGEFIHEATINALDATIGFEVDSLNIHRDIFDGWHSNYYMEKCILNLTDFHRNQKISDEDFDTILEFAKAQFEG